MASRRDASGKNFSLTFIIRVQSEEKKKIFGFLVKIQIEDEGGFEWRKIKIDKEMNKDIL